MPTSGNSTWQDSPSTATPINAARLQAIETALTGSAPVAAAWQASTAYKAGQLVTNGGNLWQSNSDHTSGGSFSGVTNWTQIGSVTVGTTSGTVAAGDDSRIVNAVPASQKGAASGVATLDSGSKIPASQTSARALGWLDLKADYGAKGDGRYVTDAVATSASPTITSATAAFTSADTGKTVMFYGAGTSGGTLIGTATYVNATTITLSGNAGTTVASGGYLLIGTDDTTAIQNAVTAAIGNNGGTIYAPRGVYVIAGAQQSGSITGTGNAAGKTFTYSGQIVYPARPFISTRNVTVTIKGETMSAEYYWPNNFTGSNTLAPMGGATFVSTATSGAVFDAISSTTGDNTANPDGRTNICALFHDLTLLVSNNPQCHGIRARYLANFGTDGVTVGVFTPDNQSITALAGQTGSVYGIDCPTTGNGFYINIRRSQVFGFPTAIRHGEGLILDDFWGWHCKVVIEAANGGHLSQYRRAGGTICGTLLKVTATGTVYVEGVLGYESAQMTWAIDDANGLAVGQIGLLCGATYNTGHPVNGAFNLNISNLGAGGVGWMNAVWPWDTFSRAIVMTNNAGASDKTSHPTQGGNGYSITASVMSCGGATDSTVFYTIQDPPTRSRVMTAKINSGSTGLINVGMMLAYNGPKGIIACLNSTGNQVVLKKRTASGTFTNLALGTAGSPGVATSTTYTLVAVWKESLVPGSTNTVDVYLNGTLAVSYTLTGTDMTDITRSDGAILCGPWHDGDSHSSFTKFRVQPLSA